MAHLLPRNAPSPLHGVGGSTSPFGARLLRGTAGARRVAAGRRAPFGALSGGQRGLQHGQQRPCAGPPLRGSSPQPRTSPEGLGSALPRVRPASAPPLRRPADVTRSGRHGGRGGRAAAGG